jgi:hypothetical protein
MKKLFLIPVISLLCISVNAQKKAITETGEEVILFDDGTWEYENGEAQVETTIPTNSKVFEKNKTSSFLLKSKKLNVGVWLNPKKWSFQKATDNPVAEYQFQLRNSDLYGMIITEQVEVPLETLRAIAVENGKAAAPDLKIVKEEYRTVNGIKVLLLQMNGTTQGIKFSYYGYYYSNENGSVQFITYTSQKLIQTYFDECETLLNGLVETK